MFGKPIFSGATTSSTGLAGDLNKELSLRSFKTDLGDRLLLLLLPVAAAATKSSPVSRFLLGVEGDVFGLE